MANRHDIYLWEMSKHPVPQSMEEARDLAENLAEQVGMLSPALFTVIEKTKAYIAQQDAQIQYAYRWFGKEQEAKGCLVLTLPDYGAELGLRFIVQTAMALDLVVYDHEMRMVFLPPDRVLPMEADEYWDALCENLDKPAFPLKESDFTKWFNPLFEKMIGRHGFVTKSLTIGAGVLGGQEIYIKNVPAGEQHISLSFEARYMGEFKPYLSFGMLCPKVYDIFKLFSFSQHTPYTFSDPMSSSLGFGIVRLKNYNECRLYLERIENSLFDFLNIASDIEGVDQLMNKNVNEKFTKRMNGFYNPHRLIVARLANNPHFEQLIIEFEKDSDWGANQAARATEWPKLLKYLREEVKPLV
jgi:hypothetical protein